MTTGLCEWRRRFGRVPWDYDARSALRDLPFTDEEYRARIAALDEVLDRHDLDGAVLHSFGVDIRHSVYFTGFQNRYQADAYVVHRLGEEPVLVTNSFTHGEPMHTEIYQTWLRDVRCGIQDARADVYLGCETASDLLRGALRDLDLVGQRLGIAGPEPVRLRETLHRAGAVRGMSDLEHELARVRSVKSPAEVTLLRETARIADAAMVSALELVEPGAAERDIAAALVETMTREGADGPIYHLQVGSGPRTGLRNVWPADRRVEPGDFVWVGVALVKDGYTGRVGGSVVAGEPTTEQRNFLEANALLVERAMSVARPGATGGEVARAVELGADRMGLRDELWFGAFGMGVQYPPDAPDVNPFSEDPIEAGQVLALYPMLIRTGFGCANSERAYHVGDSGTDPLSSLDVRHWR